MKLNTVGSLVCILLLSLTVAGCPPPPPPEKQVYIVFDANSELKENFITDLVDLVGKNTNPNTLLSIDKIYDNGRTDVLHKGIGTRRTVNAIAPQVIEGYDGTESTEPYSVLNRMTQRCSDMVHQTAEKNHELHCVLVTSGFSSKEGILKVKDISQAISKGDIGQLKQIYLIGVKSERQLNLTNAYQALGSKVALRGAQDSQWVPVIKEVMMP